MNPRFYNIAKKKNARQYLRRMKWRSIHKQNGNSCKHPRKAETVVPEQQNDLDLHVVFGSTKYNGEVEHQTCKWLLQTTYCYLNTSFAYKTSKFHTTFILFSHCISFQTTLFVLVNSLIKTPWDFILIILSILSFI